MKKRLQFLMLFLSFWAMTIGINAQTLPASGKLFQIYCAAAPNRPMNGSLSSKIYWKAQASNPQSYTLNLVSGQTNQYYINVSGTLNLGTQGGGSILKATSGETNGSDKWTLVYDNTFNGVDYYIAYVYAAWLATPVNRYMWFKSDSTVTSPTAVPPGNASDALGTARDYYRIAFVELPDQDKNALLVAINTADSTYAKSSAGPNPGQFTTDNIDALKEAIDYAKTVYNDPTSTVEDYITAKSDLNGTYEAFKTTVNVPKVSSEFEEYWYFLQGVTPVGTYMTSLGAGLAIQNKSITNEDSQLWKLAMNSTNTGLVLINKATGEYVQTDVATAVKLKTAALEPTKTLDVSISPFNSNKTFRFLVQNKATNPDFHMNSSYYTDGSVCNLAAVGTDNNYGSTWLFMDYAAAQRQSVLDEINTEKTLIASYKIGTLPGQFASQSIFDDYNSTAIADALAVYNDQDKTSDEYIAAKVALQNAFKTLKSKVNTPVISTSDANTKWYCFKSAKFAATPLMANFTTDTLNHVNYQELKINDDELWKFVPNGTGFAIQNKATNQYLNTDVVAGTELSTKTTLPTRALKFVLSSDIDATSNVLKFWVENDSTSVSFRLHAATTTMKNKIDNAADNCTWTILERADVVRSIIKTDTTTAHFVYKLSSEGTTYGKHTAEKRSGFKAIIDDINAKNIDALSENDVNSTYLSLHNAIATFKSSRINDVTTLASTSNNPKWFYIVGNNPNGTSGYTKRIGKSGSVVRGINGSGADSLMWRFEINMLDSTVMLVNKVSSEEFSIAGQSTQATLLTSGGGGAYLKLGIYNDGVSSRMTYLNGTTTELVHCDASFNIVGWNSTINDNSAWRFDAVDTGAGVKNITTTKYNIQSKNGVITVEGVDKFDVYSILGQRINSKATLRQGAYIIKINNETQKYIVK